MPVAVIKLGLALTLWVSGAGCMRNRLPKPDSTFLNDPPGQAVVRGPEEPLAVQPPAPPGGAIQPPRSELMAGSVPLMPGMPGSPSRSPAAEPAADLTLASASDDDRKGPLRRWLDERRDRRTQPPALPSALEPRKEPSTEPVKPMPPPVMPDQPKPDQQKAPEKAVLAPRTAAPDVAEARKTIAIATKSYAETPDFTARLTKRDAVGGKLQPQEDIEYAFRKEPLSIHMKVVGENGLGREVMYVKGQNNGKMSVLTGKGDLISGRKMDLDPDSPLAAGRARTKIYEAGFARPIGVITKMLDQVEAGKRPAETVKHLGSQTRKDLPGSFTGIEITFRPGDDPLLPKGGIRSYFFDADPKSAGYGLPVLITATEAGKEVEYYAFSNFRRPANLTDADFNPANLGKRR